MSFTQVTFRGREDDGSESAATWIAAEDVDWNQQADQNFRVRICCSDTSETGSQTQAFQFRVDTGGGYGGWALITGATAVKMSASTEFADGDATTEQLAGTPSNWVAGEMIESTNSAVYDATGASSGTSHEICLQLDSATIGDGDLIQIRLVDMPGSVVFGTYTATPTITADVGIPITAGTIATGYSMFAPGPLDQTVTSAGTIASGATLYAPFVIVPADYATAFREYDAVSGVVVQPPSDWIDEWGDLGDAHVHHQYTDAEPFMRVQPDADLGVGMLSWSLVGDGHADIDMKTLCVPRCPESLAFVQLAILRASGADAAENGYSVELRPWANRVALNRFDPARVAVVTGSVSDQLYYSGAPVWCRFQMIGTVPKCKVWLGAETDEPATWTLNNAGATTDSTYTQGKVGIGVGLDCYYFSVRTTADQAPLSYADFGPSVAAIVAEPDESRLEWTVQVGKRDPATDIESDLYLTDRQGGRATDARDSPASTGFYAGLAGWPRTLISPKGDFLLSGLGGVSAGSIEASNVPDAEDTAGPHDGLLTETLAQRPVIVRVGQRGARHRSFTRVLTGTVGGSQNDAEPIVTLDRLHIPVATALSRLNNRLLDRGRFTGIPTALEQLTATGTASAAYDNSFDVTQFALMVRLRMAAVPGATSTLFRKGTSATDRNFSLEVETSGRVRFRYSVGGVAFSYLVGKLAGGTDEHTLFLAFGPNDLYFMLDERVLFDAAHDGIPDLPADALTWDLICESYDRRLYDFFPDQIQARALVRTLTVTDAPGLAAWWKCNDGTGATVTDYTTAGNNATLSGVENTDYAWIASDAGEPEIAGKPYPIARGLLNNIPAMRIDAVRDRFHYGGLTGDTLEVRDQGDLLTITTDYTEEGDGILDFVDPGPGEPSTVQVDGAFGLASLLEELAGESNTTIDEDAAAGAIVAKPFGVGYFSDGDVRASGMLEEIIHGVGLSYWEDRYGRIVIAPLLPPTHGHPDGQPTLEMLGGNTRAEWFLEAGAAQDTDVDDWTVTMWLRPTINGGGRILGTTKWSLSFLYPQGFTVGKEVTSSAHTTFRNVTFRRGLWLFIAATYEAGASERLYGAHDGESVVELPEYISSIVANGFSGGTPERLQLGRAQQQSPAFSNGMTGVGRIGIWDKLLSVAEMQAAMDTPLVGTETNLVFYAPLSDRHPDGALDLVGGRRAKVVGARWTPKLTLDLAASEYTIRAYKQITPAKEVILRYDRNHAVLGHSDVVAAATQAERLRMTTEWQEIPYTDADVRDDYLAARSVEIDSAIRGQEHASLAMVGLVERLSPGWYALDFDGLDDRALALSFGDEVIVSHPRLIGSAGKAMRVVSVRPNSGGKYSVSCWG